MKGKSMGPNRYLPAFVDLLALTVFVCVLLPSTAFALTVLEHF